SQYGRPWKPGKDRVPERDLGAPAEFLRAALELDGCVDGTGIGSGEAADRFLVGLAFPAVAELHRFEMLLGNEAFSDALDPTIGIDGIDAGDLPDLFAFRRAPGIDDLLDEELALLRGRDLPGTPADWTNEAIYYPEITGPGGETTRAAIYHRLPPNTTGPGGVAYRSNYQVADNYEAAVRFPLGHGDAYGHYLLAIVTAIDLLKDGPPAWPEEFLLNIARKLSEGDDGLVVLRQLAE